MRNDHRAAVDAAAQDVGRQALLFRISRVEAVDEDVGVNEPRPRA
jgi:hypothetical protein